MIKYLILAIPLLVGCGKYWHCDDPNKPPTQICIPDQPTDYPCEAGKLYYVWLLSDDCLTDTQESFCAADDEGAKNYVETTYTDVTHGDASLDPHATEPTPVTMCGSNPTDPGQCILGSSDESMATTFLHFTDADNANCELNLDSGCTQWDAPDPQTGYCPGTM